MKTHSFLGAILALLLTAATSAAQSDYYVNAETGSNSNSGTTPASPWLTVSHALGQVSGINGARINLQPTTTVNYSISNGESFPWVLTDDISILGDSSPPPGMDVIVDVEGTGSIAIQYDANQDVVFSEIKWLTIQNATDGVEASPTGFGRLFSPTIHENQFDSCYSAVAVWAQAGVLANPRILNNTADQVGSFVRYTLNGTVADALIDGNSVNIVNYPSVGILVEGNTGGGTIVVSNNSITDASVYGIEAIGIRGFLGTVKVLANNLYGAGMGYGVRVNNCTGWSADSEIAGNVVTNFDWGISSESTDNVAIVGNAVTGGRTGIFGGWTITDNDCTSVFGYGIVINDGHSTGTGVGPTLSGNSVTNGAWSGGISVNKTGSQILGRSEQRSGEISGCVGVGVHIGGLSSGAVVDGYLIQGNGSDGIRNYAPNVTIMGNEIYFNGEAGILDHAADGNRFFGNFICNQQNPTRAAVEFTATSAATLPEFRNNTVADNSGLGLDSSLVTGGTTPFVSNNIFWNNNGLGFDIQGLSVGDYVYCDIENDPNPGMNGNFTAPPDFLLPPVDYHLANVMSPCVDAGLNSAKGWNTDFDGDPRVLDGERNGQAHVDVGADEVADTTFSLTSVSGTYQQGTDVLIEATGPPGAPFGVLVAVNPVFSPYATFPNGLDHNFYGTVLCSIPDLWVPGLAISGLNLDASGVLNPPLTVTLPVALASSYVVVQGVVGNPAFGSGQTTTAASFQIMP